MCRGSAADLGSTPGSGPFAACHLTGETVAVGPAAQLDECIQSWRAEEEKGIWDIYFLKSTCSSVEYDVYSWGSGPGLGAPGGDVSMWLQAKLASQEEWRSCVAGQSRGHHPLE